MKNLVIFALCIIFCTGFLTLGDYQQMDIMAAQQDPEVQALIKDGLQKIIDQGLEKDDFSSSNFVLTKIYSVSKQVNNGNSYIINCEFVNDEDVVVKASIQGTYQETTPDIEYPYVAMPANETDRVEGSFMQVSSLEASFSSEIQNLISSGIDEVRQKSNCEENFKDFSYQISKMRSVSRQVKETALFYKFNLQLKSDEENVTIETNFTVYYQPLQDVKSVTEYTCEEGGQGSDDSNDSLIGTIIEPEDSQYTALPDKEVNDDTLGKTALDYGREEITTIAINDGVIPNTTLEVLEVTEAESQIVGNGIFYKFRCKLSDSANVTLTAVFSVYFDLNSSEKIMVEYSYETNNEDSSPEEEIPEDGFEKLSIDQLQSDTEANNTFEFGAKTAIKQNIADGQLPDQDLTWTTVTKAEKKSGDKGNLYKFGCDIAGSQENQAFEMNFVVYYQLSSERRTLSSFSHKAKENSVINTTKQTDAFPVIPINGEYVLCTQEEIDSDQDIKNALDYGANQISIRAIQDENVSASNFTIKTVNNVSKQTTATITSYRCNVEIENPDGTTNHAEFTVFYDPSTQEYSLWSYFYDEGGSGAETNNTMTWRTQVANTGYTDVKTDEIKYNSEIQSCIKFGAEQVIPDARYYTLTKVNKVSRKVVESTLYYKCDIEMTQNSITIQLTFTVFYQPEINQKDVIAYSYETRKSSRSSSSSSVPSSGWWRTSNSWSYQNSSSSSGAESSSNPSFNAFSSYNYTKIPVSTIDDDPTYNDIYYYGIDQLLNQLQDNRVVSDTKFDPSEPREMFTQDAGDYENCMFKVRLTNSAGLSLDVSFNVQSETETGKMNLTSYSCEGSSPGQTQVVIADYQGENGNQMYVGNYEKQVPEQREIDPALQEAIDYGVDQVKKNVNAEEDNVDTSAYNVKELTNVFKKMVDDSSYRVDAILADDQGGIIDCSFIVYYQPSTDEKKLEFFSYIMYRDTD